jgi:hypothetical protein
LIWINNGAFSAYATDFGLHCFVARCVEQLLVTFFAEILKRRESRMGGLRLVIDPHQEPASLLAELTFGSAGAYRGFVEQCALDYDG